MQYDNVILVTLKCGYIECGAEFEGRTYQKFCSRRCQEADYYIKIKKRRKRFRQEVECDVCGTVFLTNRRNAKRCSESCARSYRSSYSAKRNKIQQDRMTEIIGELTCNVCEKKFKSSHFQFDEFTERAARASQEKCSRLCTTRTRA